MNIYIAYSFLLQKKNYHAVCASHKIISRSLFDTLRRQFLAHCVCVFVYAIGWNLFLANVCKHNGHPFLTIVFFPVFLSFRFFLVHSLFTHYFQYNSFIICLHRNCFRASFHANAIFILVHDFRQRVQLNRDAYLDNAIIAYLTFARLIDPLLWVFFVWSTIDW